MAPMRAQGYYDPIAKTEEEETKASKRRQVSVFWGGKNWEPLRRENATRTKKCVDEIKQNLRDFPDRRWAILGGAVVGKGSCVRYNII